jgi:ELWxxDGT repeat protein
VSGTVYFRANDGSSGYELWKSDGTGAGTVRVKDILRGSGTSSPSDLTNVGGTLYFTADDGSSGFELWKSDGTETGTVLVEDLTGDSLSAGPRSITLVDDRLLIVADSDIFGREIWSGTLGSLQGDFDRNGLLELADIDALVAVIADGDNPVRYDLTNDALVNTRDLDLWLELGGAANLGPGLSYLPGDANLDGSVNQADFDIWNANKFTSVAAWSRGDFNADGVVDGSDFGIWNAHKHTSSDGGRQPRQLGLGIKYQRDTGDADDAIERKNRWRHIDLVFGFSGSN